MQKLQSDEHPHRKLLIARADLRFTEVDVLKVLHGLSDDAAWQLSQLRQTHAGQHTAQALYVGPRELVQSGEGLGL